ncbi:DUF551 domain-containing protein [Rhizobium sp. ERR 922]|uniref:DUF551 domain-containing protein n=1 Tax=Rhizobium sp. ERR 922 TaxID=2572675 RepID=UPI0011A9BEEF|nr:DUF551 domain-containing protein [Rhizobium sp. ERR 922]
MTTPHDKALAELRNRLEKLPKSDRGISWQLYNWQHTEELTVYGATANCLKWIIDNTDEIIAALHAPIEAGNGGEGWLPIDDEAKSGKDILVFGVDAHGTSHYEVASYEPTESAPWVWHTHDGLAYHEGAFSHWRPLPAPPSIHLPLGSPRPKRSAMRSLGTRHHE